MRGERHCRPSFYRYPIFARGALYTNSILMALGRRHTQSVYCNNNNIWYEVHIILRMYSSRIHSTLVHNARESSVRNTRGRKNPGTIDTQRIGRKTRLWVYFTVLYDITRLMDDCDFESDEIQTVRSTFCRTAREENCKEEWREWRRTSTFHDRYLRHKLVDIGVKNVFFVCDTNLLLFHRWHFN